MKTFLYNQLKIILKSILPARLLNLIKKKHYQTIYYEFPIEQEPDLLIIKELVEPGDIVIDIGANIGLYTKYLSEFVGEDGEVHSIEPIPETFKFLRTNIKQNKYRNVFGYNYAISDSDKTVTMDIPSVTAGRNYFRAKITTEPTKMSYQIQAKTLDGLFSNKTKINFIKCDVEGHEYPVIVGAFEIIKEKHPNFLIEIDGKMEEGGSTANKLYNRLLSEKYTCWIYKNNKLEEWTTGLTSINYFFITNEAVLLLKKKKIIK